MKCSTVILYSMIYNRHYIMMAITKKNLDRKSLNQDCNKVLLH